MKTIYTYLLLFFLISLLCLNTESFGQCELKYTYTVKNTATGVDGGEVIITFQKGLPMPNCLLFNYTNNTPTLLTEANRRTDTAANQIVFYGLTPGRYLVRANQKGCKALIIGQEKEIIVSTINAR